MTAQAQLLRGAGCCIRVSWFRALKALALRLTAAAVVHFVPCELKLIGGTIFARLLPPGRITKP